MTEIRQTLLVGVPLSSLVLYPEGESMRNPTDVIPLLHLYRMMGGDCDVFIRDI